VTRASILFVRVDSDVEAGELERRVVERRPQFLQVPGLVQKIYGRDPDTGAWCGIYFFESDEALAAYRASELARTIPVAYEATAVRAEVYDVVFPLLPERGPLPAGPVG
jgi:hypothetical protein